ncbi:MAG: TetR/AcrR family transcriptional regulator [Propionibacteriaceae bacterium]|nr:TetR/AcrR family transcriptional regulator [Propionibacteriaceae bacterium]
MTVGTLSKRQVAKREQIATAGRKLFLAHGFAGTSMDAVTAEAGVSKQTLYTYFPAKADLLKAILERELARLALEGPLPEPQTFPELRGLLLQFVTRLTQTLLHPDSVALIRLVLGEAFRIPELRDTVRQALPMRALQGIATIVGRADVLGLIEAPDTDLTARMLLGPIMSYVALDGFLTTEPVVQPSADKLERMVDMFLTMVAVTP